MTKLLIWFQTNYPELKQALHQCNHNFDESETNPYHIEGDCWSHTMMVCKIAELKGYDRVVKIAALLHDIGKPNSRKINPKNNHVQFFGHEKLSAEMAKPLVDDLIKREMLTTHEAHEVLMLISLHGDVYKHRDEVEKKLSQKPEVLQHLLELSTCDNLGRFSANVN
jgi:putative nucleotidyltransferase with HDIG domain